MERPAKRARIANSDTKPPHDAGSRLTGDLFTSEMGIRSDESDNTANIPTQTIQLLPPKQANLNRKLYTGQPRVLRRSEARHLILPRVPDVTITASVFDIAVGDLTKTLAATEVPIASIGSIVSISNVGSVTVPGVSAVTSIVSSLLSDVSSILTTSPPVSLPTDTTTITSSPGLPSSLSDTLSSTIVSNSSISANNRTVTVTATSTIQLALINGTIIPTTFSKTLAPANTRDSSGTASETASTETTSQTASGIDSSNLSETTSFSGTATGAAGAGSSGAITSSPAASPTSGGNSTSSGPGLTPTQQHVVGGVVGGVAGIAIILLIALVLLRWYRRRLKARGELPEQIAQRNLGSAPTGHFRSISEKSGAQPLTSAIAHSLKRWRPQSSHTMNTSITGMTGSTVPESERGFQRISGRKIAPALSTGGDGYGDDIVSYGKNVNAGPFENYTPSDRDLAGSSFYHDSHGFYGGKGTSSPTYPSSPTQAGTRQISGSSLGPSSSRDFAVNGPGSLNPSQLSLGGASKPEGLAVLRPSPARTPVTSSPATSSIKLPIQQTPALDDDAPPLPMGGLIVPGRDGVGRSLASQDGSRVSRGSIRSVGRFTENLS